MTKHADTRRSPVPSAPRSRPQICELLDSIPDPVIGCDAAGRVVFWSPAAGSVYGYRSEEAVGQPMVTLLQTRFPLPWFQIMDLLGDLGHWQGNLVHRTKDGREVRVESRWVGRYDHAGRLVGGFGIERLESTGQPAAGVAHDLNNALAIIINYAALAAIELERAPEEPASAQSGSLRGDLAEIQAAAQQAAQLTRGLLALCRHDPPMAPDGTLS